MLAILMASQAAYGLLLLACTALIWSACSGSAPVAHEDPEGVTSDYYIQITTGNTITTVQEMALDEWEILQMEFEGTQALTGTSRLTSLTYLFSRVFRIDSNRMTAGGVRNNLLISFIKKYDGQPSQADLDELVRNTFSYGSSEKRIDGIEIRWIDSTNNIWSTAHWPGTQDGSTFRITEQVRLDAEDGMRRKTRYRTKGVFNCTLYDTAGNSIKVRNGAFSLKTGSYN